MEDVDTKVRRVDMIRAGLVGLGKMGISHYAILNSHPNVALTAVCDSNKFLLDVLDKYSSIGTYSDYSRMLDECKLDCVVIATPSKFHGSMVRSALDHDLHVFCEKPFCLDVGVGEDLVALANAKGLVNQVGYHYRFVSSFVEAKRIVDSGALGRIHNVRAEAYGPVVLRPKGSTWRADKDEGGGCLLDYAAHAIDLVNLLVGVPQRARGVVLGRVFSQNVDDEVYATLDFAGGISGQLAVNWSDESFRKMSTAVTVWGTNGRVTADRQECQVYLRKTHLELPGVKKGWTVRYTTDLTKPCWYYLRGEEYSAQIDYFVRAILDGNCDNINSFASAHMTDRVAQMIVQANDGRDERGKR
jgi:predicted dehydrogenase